ncbi:hypothetical protein BX600DRAFT_503381 [Xylariales sp. PMI_506]|nr:hypothetical protein BX600DRAFT_503381 [Xylariales sp. PMI_506]
MESLWRWNGGPDPSFLRLHTVDIVTVHIVHKTGTNAEAIGYAAIAPLTDDEISQFEYGSKVEFVAWYSYHTLHKRTWRKKLMRTTRSHLDVGRYRGTGKCFRIRVKSAPLGNKMSGFLRYSMLLTLSAHPSSIVVNSWSVRETIVGLLAINLPILRPLFSYRFWKRGPLPDARRPNPPHAAGDDFGRPIRRINRRQFGTLFGLNSFLTTIITNKMATTATTGMSQVENSYNSEAPTEGHVQQPQLENHEVVRPMANGSREKEDKTYLNCENIQQSGQC